MVVEEFFLFGTESGEDVLVFGGDVGPGDIGNCELRSGYLG